MHRPRLAIVFGILAAITAAATWGGFLRGFGNLALYESVMIGTLCAYAGMGVVAAFAGRFESARHVANGLPIWALCMTGLGILLAVTELNTLSPTALTVVFRDLALAISPNVVGIALMAAIREAIYWAAGEGM